ncbi:MAG TPA: hypothetical protein PKC18_11370 [Lacipirellulaceae bacterium]|nr:hypothetical protein [Lacipirellulaceae bacterium]
MNRTNLARGLAVASLLAAAALAAPRAAALSLTPGTILGVDSGAPGGATFTLVQFSPTGTVLDTLALTNTAQLGTLDGLALVGSQLFVGGTNNFVGSVDLGTGVVSNYFNTGSAGLEALGELNGNLLVGDFGAAISVFSTAGALLNTITPSMVLGTTGVDSDGSQLFVANYNDGRVYTLDLTGTVQSSFDTGAGASSLSGLAYDAGSNTLWVSTGFNQGDIRQFDLSGNLLTSFASGYPFIDSLEVIPIPEPAAGALGAAAAVLLTRRRTGRGAG